MLHQCWSSVYDADPTLTQHWLIGYANAPRQQVSPLFVYCFHLYIVIDYTLLYLKTHVLL